MLGGGFGFEGISDDDQDASQPFENGWYCEDDVSYAGAECYAVCGDAKEDYEMTCETVEVQGSFNDGIEVMCNAGTYLTSGGFYDASGNDDDQDYNHPIDNGWYCEEDRSDGDSVCYARCCSFEESKPPRSCEDFGFDYFVAKWGWEGSWSSEGSDGGTLVTGDDELASWFVGTSEADGIVAKAGLEYEAVNGTSGTMGEIGGHDLSHILFCAYDEPGCVEDIVFGCWEGWEDDECIAGWMNQTRTRLEYDANVCGTFEDVIHTDTRSVVCEMPCVEDIVNGSWSGWEDSECVDNLKTQTRTRVEYDANSCGGFSNITYTDSKEVECGEPICYEDLDCGEPGCAGGPNYCGFDEDVYQDYLFPECINPGQLDAYCEYTTILPWLIEDCHWGCLFGVCLPEPQCEEYIMYEIWSEWENISECSEGFLNQSRTRVEYDANSCGTFENVTHTDTRSVECEMPCVEEIVNESWSEWENSSECIGGFMDQTRTRMEYDLNSCGVFNNITHEDSRDVECEMPCVEDIVITIWTVWENTTECSENGTLTQTRTRFESDANNCGTFPSGIQTETREVNCSIPECCDDEDCEEDYYSEKYCVGDDVYKDFYDYSCEEGSCEFNVTEFLVEECDDYCSDGICKRERTDGDNKHNSTQFERFEIVNQYENQGTINLNDTNIISLGDDVSDSNFDLWTLLPWLMVLLILILLILIIRFI